MDLVKTTAKFYLPVMITSVGGYKTFADFKKSNEDNKYKILAKDTIILSGTCGGAYSGYSFFNKLLNKIPAQRHIARQFIKTAGIPLGSILGGIVSGAVAEKLFPVKTNSLKKVVEKKLNNIIGDNEQDKTRDKLIKNAQKIPLVNQLDPKLIGKSYDYLNLGVESAFEDVFATLSGFDIGRQEDKKDKLLQSSYEVVSGIVVPATFLSVTSSYLDKKQLSPKTKGALMAAILVGGIVIGNKVGEWFNKKIMENVIKKEFWQQVSERKQNLVQKSFKNLNPNEFLKTQKSMLKLDTLKSKLDSGKSKNNK